MIGPTAQLGAVIVAKGAIMATVAVAVISDTGLTRFEQALIIAIVSAGMTGIFTVCAAIIAVRATRLTRDEVSETHQMVAEAVDPTNGIGGTL